MVMFDPESTFDPKPASLMTFDPKQWLKKAAPETRRVWWTATGEEGERWLQSSWLVRDPLVVSFPDVLRLGTRLDPPDECLSLVLLLMQSWSGVQWSHGKTTWCGGWTTSTTVQMCTSPCAAAAVRRAAVGRLSSCCATSAGYARSGLSWVG